MKLLISIALLLTFGCVQTPTVPSQDTNVPPQDTTPPISTPEPLSYIPLYWENTTSPRPERAPWTKQLSELIKQNLTTYSEAKDIGEICSKFYSLTDLGKIKAIGEFFVAMAYYESSFNPNSASVDVGTQGDKGSWSVGLYQMSGNDGSAKKFGCDFTCLQDPLMNIKVANEQMVRQITRTGLILLPNSNASRYWAVILKGNKYSKIADIQARVKKYAPECN